MTVWREPNECNKVLLGTVASFALGETVPHLQPTSAARNYKQGSGLIRRESTKAGFYSGGHIGRRFRRDQQFAGTAPSNERPRYSAGCKGRRRLSVRQPNGCSCRRQSWSAQQQRPSHSPARGVVYLQQTTQRAIGSATRPAPDTLGHGAGPRFHVKGAMPGPTQRHDGLRRRGRRWPSPSTTAKGRLDVGGGLDTSPRAGGQDQVSSTTTSQQRGSRPGPLVAFGSFATTRTP